MPGFSYEVRNSAQYFDDIQDIKITKEMLELAKHIVEAKSGHFEPDKFEDYYKSALTKLLAEKQKGLPIATDLNSANVISLRDALKKSLAAVPLKIEISGQHDDVANCHSAWPRQHEHHQFATSLASNRLPDSLASSSFSGAQSASSALMTGPGEIAPTRIPCLKTWRRTVWTKQLIAHLDEA